MSAPGLIDRPAALIDWPAALAAALAAVRDPAATAAAVERALAAAPVFRNREFPLCPVPVLLRAEPAARAAELLERYVALLGRVVALFREHAEVRAYYAVDPAAERLIGADRALGDAPWVCRLDGYLEAGSERLRLLENNADAPAGTLFTARVNAVVAGIGAELSIPALPTPAAGGELSYTGEERFVGCLRAAAGAAAARDPGRCAEPESVAVLQPAGRPNAESVELVATIRRTGLDAFLADPRSITVSRDRTRFDGRTAELVWNKVNTVVWHAWCADDAFVATWERALAGTSMVHVNPFGARYVAENKLALGFVQEPEFAHLFTTAERALVAELVPWSRRLAKDTCDTDGEPLVPRLLADPRPFVLKQPYDIRGDGVTIGHDCPPAQWCAALDSALDEGHLVQRAVAPTTYPVVDADTGRVEAMPISLDTFVLGGVVAGFGSKGSRNSRINVFQGGRKLAVRVSGPASRTGEGPT